MKTSWGTGIAFSYLLFVLIILGILAFSMGQDVNLVSPDYYEEELEYQEKIEKINRTNQLKDIVELEIIGDILIITFPQIFDPEKISGNITLYRPSDRHEDKSFVLNLHDDWKQQIIMNEFKHGFWRVKLDWEINELGYYFEKNIIVE